MVRRKNNFVKSKQAIVAFCMVLAVVTCLTGLVFTQKIQKDKMEQTNLAKNEGTENTEKQNLDEIARQMLGDEYEENKKDDTAEASLTVTKKTQTTEKKEEPKENKITETVGTAAIQSKPQNVEHHFDGNLIWPAKGSVLMEYSMDKSIYFQTLDEYKYNPAMILQSDIGNEVKAAASGTIVQVKEEASTGTTVTMDIGDGYELIYGQLSDLPFKEGAYVEAGDVIGCVNTPTKYYSKEGSNIYFAMKKDGKPVNPADYLTD